MRLSLFLLGLTAICTYRPEWIWNETAPWPIVISTTFGACWALAHDVAEVVLRARNRKL